MKTVLLNSRDIRESIESAQLATERWQKKNFSYYSNSLTSHINGRLGEVAVEKYMLQSGRDDVISHFRFPEREKLCDLEVGGTRIEVKTWRRHLWQEFGRCVAVAQFERIRKKADCIVWCTVPPYDGRMLPSLESMEAQIIGWSTMDDIAAAQKRTTKTYRSKPVFNYQLEPASIRVM